VAAAVLEQQLQSGWILASGSPLAGQPVAAAQARWDLGSRFGRFRLTRAANTTSGRAGRPEFGRPAGTTRNRVRQFSSSGATRRR